MRGTGLDGCTGGHGLWRWRQFNDQHLQFLFLLADSSTSHSVVENWDRCSRFGVAYMQTLLKTHSRKLVMLVQPRTRKRTCYTMSEPAERVSALGSMAAGGPAASGRNYSRCWR